LQSVRYSLPRPAAATAVPCSKETTATAAVPCNICVSPIVATVPCSKETTATAAATAADALEIRNAAVLALGILVDYINAPMQHMCVSPEIQLPKSLEVGIKHLTHDLEEINSFLVDLSSVEVEHPSVMVKRWMDEVRELSYDKWPIFRGDSKSSYPFKSICKGR
jgi:hypothetical protein